MTPDPDPLLEARMWECLTCGGLAHPVDAAWAGEGLVLAEFVQLHRGGCYGLRRWSALIDTAADDGEVPLPPKDNGRRAAGHYRTRPCRSCGQPATCWYCGTCRCTYWMDKTRRCRNKVSDDGLCTLHLKVTARNGGRNRKSR